MSRSELPSTRTEFDSMQTEISEIIDARDFEIRDINMRIVDAENMLHAMSEDERQISDDLKNEIRKLQDECEAAKCLAKEELVRLGTKIEAELNETKAAQAEELQRLTAELKDDIEMRKMLAKRRNQRLEAMKNIEVQEGRANGSDRVRNAESVAKEYAEHVASLEKELCCLMREKQRGLRHTNGGDSKKQKEAEDITQYYKSRRDERRKVHKTRMDGIKSETEPQIEALKVELKRVRACFLEVREAYKPIEATGADMLKKALADADEFRRAIAELRAEIKVLMDDGQQDRVKLGVACRKSAEMQRELGFIEAEIARVKSGMIEMEQEAVHLKYLAYGEGGRPV